MTTKQIESLVESVEARMVDELGEYPRIEILGYESGDYDVQFCWEGHGVEHSEIVATDMKDEELEYFMTEDVDSWLREFYYRMKNGMSLWENAHVKLARFVIEQGCIPTDVYVDVRWKSDGDKKKHKCICCSKEVYAEQAADDFNPHLPLSNGKMDDAYMFYCNGIQEFLGLLKEKNGEDFEIIDVHGWD